MAELGGREVKGSVEIDHLLEGLEPGVRHAPVTVPADFKGAAFGTVGRAVGGERARVNQRGKLGCFEVALARPTRRPVAQVLAFATGVDTAGQDGIEFGK
jgi:hypothetical protein